MNRSWPFVVCFGLLWACGGASGGNTGASDATSQGTHGDVASSSDIEPSTDGAASGGGDIAPDSTLDVADAAEFVADAADAALDVELTDVGVAQDVAPSDAALVDAVDAAADVTKVECSTALDCAGIIGTPICHVASCSAGKCTVALASQGDACDTDGLPCTTETCDSAGTCVFGGLASGWCGMVVGGASTCVADGAANPANSCQVCKANVDPSAWTPLVLDSTCGPTTKGCVRHVCGPTGTCIAAPDASLCSAAGSAPCKVAQCDETFGCKSSAVPAGTPCNGDSVACTIEVCDGAANCLAAGTDPAACDDQVVCTVDVCAAGIGCTHTATDGACDDGNVCTADTCDVSKGCQHAPQGGPCSDGLTCTPGDSCTNGTCVAGAPVLWTKTMTASGSLTTVEVLAVPGGDLLIAGNDSSNAIGMVRRLDAAGQEVWKTTLGSDVSFVHGLVRADDGTVYAYGDSMDGAASMNGTVWPLDANGKPAQTQVSSSTDKDSFGCAVQASNKDLVVGGWRNGLNGHHLLVERRKPDGTLAWSKELGSGSSGDGATHIVRVDSAGKSVGFVLTGVLDGSIAALQLDGAGNVVWQRPYPQCNDYIRGLVALPDGYAFATSWTSGASWGPALVRTDLMGQPIWMHYFNDLNWQSARTLIGTADGFLVGGSMQGVGMPTTGAFARTDIRGNVLWTQTLAGYSSGAARWPEGKIALVAGQDNSSAPTVQVVRRADAWGTAVCASAGVCADMDTTGCSDGNSCTLDLCADSALGTCSHVPASNGSPCEDGVTCTAGDTCTGGSCKSGGAVYVDLALAATLPNAIGAMQDGTVVLAGSKAPYSDGLAWLANVDTSGNVIWQQTVGIVPASLEAVSRSNSAITTACGYQGTTKYGYPHALFVRTAADGTVTWQTDAGLDGGCWAIEQFADKTAIAAGGHEYAEPSWVVKLKADGSIAWKYDVDIGRPARVGVAADGTSFVVSSSYVANFNHSTLRKFGADGKLLWQQDVGVTAGSGDVLPLSDGGALLAAFADATGDNPPWLFQFTSSGKVVWQKSYPSGVAYTSAGTARLSQDQTGFVLATTTLYAATSSDARILRVSPSGTVQLDKGIGSPKSEGLSDMLLMPDGGVWVVGSQVDAQFAPIHGWMVRTDPNGNGGCTGSGKCFGVALGGCDDGDPCTADACDPGKGCSHTFESSTTCVP